MPEGTASRPLSTRHGWHLFLVEGKRSEFQDVRETAKRRWCELRRPDTLAELRQRFQVDAPNGPELVKKLTPPLDPSDGRGVERGVLKP